MHFSLLILDCITPNADEILPVVPHVALVSIQATSPERRFTQKEIIAGEERPKYLLIKQHQDAAAAGNYNALSYAFIQFLQRKLFNLKIDKHLSSAYIF